MAWFLCDCGPHRNPIGKNRHVYVGTSRPGQTLRWTLRLCDAHFLDVQEHLAQFEVDTESYTVGIGGSRDACVACFEKVDELGTQVFITSYPAKEQRKDYWGKLHDDCRLPRCLLEPATLAPGPAAHLYDLEAKLG